MRVHDLGIISANVLFDQMAMSPTCLALQRVFGQILKSLRGCLFSNHLIFSPKHNTNKVILGTSKIFRHISNECQAQEAKSFSVGTYILWSQNLLVSLGSLVPSPSLNLFEPKSLVLVHPRSNFAHRTFLENSFKDPFKA